MNAIIVLCHFCEQHGPSVVMCTQPYLQSVSRSPGNVAGLDHQGCDPSSIKRAVSHARLSTAGGSGDNRGVDNGTGQILFSPDASSTHAAFRTSPATSQQLSFPTPSTCRACSFAIRDESGLVSHDHVACTSYVSTQWPKDPDLHNFVMTACQRSLSCEVCPGPDGAFYFGDEVNGHVISYNFQVQDTQARGLKSQYSFLVVSWDRVFLLTLWPFLVSNFSKMASRIQGAASQVFTSEINNSKTSSVSTSRSGPSTSRHVSLVTLSRGTASPGCVNIAGLSAIAVPGGQAVRQRRAMDADMRSLATLTKDEQIFYRIHSWFTWLLRAGARRWTVLPSHTAPPNEDLLIDQEERQAIIVTGADHLANGGSQGSSSSISLAAQIKSAVSKGILSTDSLGLVKCLSLSGDSTEEETSIALSVLTHLLQSLGPRDFGALAHHVVVGNQLVVQPLDENLLGLLVVLAISKLLPRGCLKQIVFSPEYLPPFRCNLLSLCPDAKPAELDWRPGGGVQFITVYRKRCDQPNSVEQLVNSLQFRLCSTIPSVDPSLDHLRTKDRSNDIVIPPVITGSAPPIPSFVSRITQLLNAHPPLPPQTLDSAIASARQEWINRARLLYSFKRCQVPTLAGEETTRRWAGVLSALGCSSPENANLALFWQGALSQYSRQNPCHSNRRGSTSTQTSRRTSVCSSNTDLTAAMAAASMMD